MDPVWVTRPPSHVTGVMNLLGRLCGTVLRSAGMELRQTVSLSVSTCRTWTMVETAVN